MSALKVPTSYLIAGIGNKTMPYTRHSAGLLMVEALAKSFDLNLKPVGRLNCLCAQTTVRILRGTPEEQDMKFIFANSQAFMNLSGPPIAEALRYYFGKGDAHSLILIHDSIEYPSMAIKPKQSGSAKGHNGVESVKKALGSGDFWRIRLGVGEYDRNMKKREMADFVLADLTGAERRYWGQPGRGLDKVWEAVEGIVEKNQKVMQKAVQEQKHQQDQAKRVVTQQKAYDEFMARERQEAGIDDDNVRNDHGLPLPKH
ncbi:peptidyl-tRNA hydrolase [Calocera viscosa TUFC12733]|uniref:Peptidyl-tRNA hydrolase n=1 Tax=Calocera viscosa (strain TUFC12733) TaxID=1330018 RepID=A0A167NJ15_CALVF|nr:peptidyl-tRNA hydrolase [Calocera viscosa TUFC12733]